MTQNEIQPDIKTSPNAYGFGKDWSLVLKKDDKIIDEKMLGQGVKVAQRTLGIRDYMEHYAERYRALEEDKAVVSFADVSEMIAEDIIAVMTGAEYDPHLEALVGGMPLTDENLEKLADKPSWSMAVE